MTNDHHPARALWHAIEPLHAVTYFAPEVIDAAKATGLRGFWMTYFGCRAAPMGSVGPSVVEATFANFAPHMVRRSLPDAWNFADPERLVVVRAEAAAVELRRYVEDLDALAERVNPTLARIVGEANGIGRPLFTANRDVVPFDDPVAELWQLCTTLREHRGDGHVIALAAAGLAGCEVHQVMAAANGLTDELFQESRGWTDDEWASASARLEMRGLVADGGLTDAGRALNRSIEDTTDALALVPLEAALSSADLDRLIDMLGAAARTVASAGVIRFPNPMGLPAIHEWSDDGGGDRASSSIGPCDLR